MRLLILQTGDYGEAWHRFRSGGDETFRDQRHSVEFVQSLLANHDITVVARCNRIHDEALLPGLRSMGVPSEVFYSHKAMSKLLAALAPETVILATPNSEVLKLTATLNLPLLPIFADMFTRGSLRTKYRNWKLSRALRRANCPCVGNHSLEASKSLRLLHIPPSKIVPWEHLPLVADPEPKQTPTPHGCRLLFVGAASIAKGLGDCIDAVAKMRARGMHATLTCYGPGDIEPFRQQALRLDLAGSVIFGGTVSSQSIRLAMRDHDVVVVPSRHDYPEGLPNTIFEALASRTPLVASDHPAFAPRLSPGIDSLQFTAGDPASLADQVQILMSDHRLYCRLSEASANALASLYVGVESTELIRMFLADPENATGWVMRHSLANLQQRPGATSPR